MLIETAPWDRPTDQHRTLRLHPHSPSRGLRGDNVARCTLCDHHVWYFDREDGGRIPLVPGQFPTRAVPPRARWSVDGGQARFGDMGRASCWIAHPSVCPGVDHDDNDEELAGARRALAWRTRKAIEEGRFTAPLRVSIDEAEDAPVEAPAHHGPRDIVDIFGTLMLGPNTVDKIRCVSLSASKDQRCGNTVFDENERYQGQWVEAEVPVPAGRVRGRAHQDDLWAGQMMWVYVLAGVDRDEQVRWRDQRCHDHADGSSLADALGPEWVRFSLFRHDVYISTQKPTHAKKAEKESREGRVRCAGHDCINGKVGAVRPHEVINGLGWLCWKCRPKHERRKVVERRWQNPDER